MEHGGTSSSTDHTGAGTSSRSPAGAPLGDPDAFLVGLLAGAAGAAWGGLAGGATGAVGAVCAAAYSLTSEDITALGAAAGLVGSIVGGVVGGAFCGALGGAVGATASRRAAGPGYLLVSDVALATLGCATGGAIGCSFHKTVGAVGGAAGAAFGALAAREGTSHLVQSFGDFGRNRGVAQLMQPLQRFREQQDRNPESLGQGRQGDEGRCPAGFPPVSAPAPTD